MRRYYTSGLGRFLSADPFGGSASAARSGSWNRYAYVEGDPVNRNDPSGMYDEEDLEDAEEGWYGGGGDGGFGFFVEEGPSFIDNGIPNFTVTSSTPSVTSNIFFGCTPQDELCTNSSSGQVVPNPAGVPGIGDESASLFGLVTAGVGMLGGIGEAITVANPVPTMLSRVVPAGIPLNTLGPPEAVDVFVTATVDIENLTAAQIAERLTIPPSPTGYTVIDFPTPPAGIASPVFRNNPGFVGGGLTAGGAREFVLPNQPIPPRATIRTVP